jgi:hypothetical protein
VWKKSNARVRELSDYLSQLVSPCRYVDSLAFSRPGEWPTLDGLHLTPEAERNWGADVAGAVIRMARDTHAR